MQGIRCPLCGTSLVLSPAHSRKAQKPKVFLMLACPVSGKHFRGFISDQDYVLRVMHEAAKKAATDSGDS